MLDGSTAGGRRAARSSDPVDRWAEQHASRSLVLGIAFGCALIALVVLAVDDVGGPAVAAVAIALVLALVVLLYGMATGVVRATLGSSRRHQAVSQVMLRAAEAFADEPAGVDGTVEALCRSARDAAAEVLVWDAADRVLWSPLSGERHHLNVATAKRLEDAAATRRPVLVPDVSVFGGMPATLANRFGTRAVVLAPMVSGDVVLGLVLKRYASAARMYRADDASLVGSLAAIGAVALGKAMVVEGEVERAQETALLLRSAHLGSSQRAAREVLDAAARHAAEAVGGRRAAVFAFGTGQLRCVGGWQIDGTGPVPPPLPVRASLVRRARTAPHSSHVLRIASLDDGCAEVLTGLGFVDGVVVHGVADDRGLVAVVVAEHLAAAVTTRQDALLGAVANQVAAALDREQLNRAKLRRSRHLSRTPKLARRITGQRDPWAVARIAARELHEGFGFGRVTIALVDDVLGGGLRIAASSGMLARTSSSEPSTAVLDLVQREGQPYICCTGDGDGAVRDELPDPNAPAGCRSQITVPIVAAESRVVGVVSVYERNPDALDEDDLHTLETVADQLAATLEQAGLFATLERSYFKTVEALAAALEAKDAYTLSHAQSITETSAQVGRLLGMGDDEIRDLKLGALLHDIGKIGVPGSILNKPGPLTDAEYEVMKEHTRIGEQIIAPIEFLEGVRPLVLHEHERWDGAGYPHGLRGPAIPLGARIIFVCDAYHAMTSDRPYRRGLPEAEARRRLRRAAGSQFDPRVVEAFLEVLDAEQGAVVEATPV